MRRSFNSQSEIREHQLATLQRLASQIIPANRFYTEKFKTLSTAIPGSLDDFCARFPFTTKAELAQDQATHPPYGSNLTFPLKAYTRFHQTSGTSGKPLVWLDTRESWGYLVEQWLEVCLAAGVKDEDHVFFAFSFGPFIGFWLAFEAAEQIGCLCFPGGGLSSLARLRMIIEKEITAICCTPTYAIHLGETARKEGIDLAKGSVRLLMVAGEPGGSLPATRGQIEKLWPGARVFDHHGMTEIGPATYECPQHPCRLHLIEWAYFAEVVDSATAQPTPVGQTGELVLTNMLRNGSPLLRYRTGDLVRLAGHHARKEPCLCGRWETAFEGGILGRCDDMVVVRGVNVFPSAVEQIVRGFSEIAEYQVHVNQRGALREIHVTVEPVPEVKNPVHIVVALEKAFQAAFSLRIPVNIAPASSLPRAELKARRWLVDQREI